jgi:tetratricopeptide (TPR) repeat protein
LSTQYKIWLALLVTIFCVLAAVWQVSNFKGSRARGRRRKNPKEDTEKKRYSDKRRFTSLEKKMLAEARKMLSKGKITSAARLLEQLGMHREAIQALEENGLIHEAAKMLMRLQRHNRAGVIYARHGMWEFAAQCFKIANMPLEVAKCSKEAGDHDMAAEYFEKAERFEEAADFHFISGSIRKAAELFLRGGVHVKAIVAYNKVGVEEKNLASLKFSPHEIDFICLSLENRDVLGSNIDGLVNILLTTDRTVRLLIKIIELGFTDQGTLIFKKSPIDLGPQIMSEISFQNSSSENFATVFVGAKAFNYAGMVYEKMQSFIKAGDSFEKAEEIDRAIYCYERAGVPVKVNFLKAKKKEIRPKKDSGHGNPFAMEDTDPNFQSSDEGNHRGKLKDHHPKENLPFNSEESTRLVPLITPDNQGQTLGRPESGLPTANENQIFVVPPPPLSKKSSPDIKGMVFTLDLDSNNGGLASGEDDRRIFCQTTFLADLNDEQRLNLWDLGTLRHVPKGEKILSYHEDPAGLYVILKGKVDCYKLVKESEVFLDQMKPPDSFGELWLLTDSPSSVKFIAAEGVTLRIIDRLQFIQLLDKDGAVARKLYKKLTSRLLLRHQSPQNDKTKKQVS